MFNWQAPPGSKILSSHFWIYWAVTIPLTLFVLTVWTLWLQTHNGDEPKFLRGQATVKDKDLFSRSSRRVSVLRLYYSVISRIYEYFMRPFNPIDRNVEIASRIENLRRRASADFTLEVPTPANILVQGPRR